MVSLKANSIELPLVKKTAGGICSWPVLEKQVLGHLGEGAYVTIFIDYYGIKKDMKYPGWEEAETLKNKDDKINFLETQMYNAIKNNRFIPYYQLHEFESLLFNDISYFEQLFPQTDIVDKKYLSATLKEYPNPEQINNGEQTSPSHRMLRIIRGYEKVLYGNMLAMEIGLERIRSKCPRFDAWLTRLELI